jgi:hypothetical protein
MQGAADYSSWLEDFKLRCLNRKVRKLEGFTHADGFGHNVDEAKSEIYVV